MRRRMSLSEHLSRSQSVNVFCITLGNTFFFIKNWQLDRVVHISLLFGLCFFRALYLKGNRVNLDNQEKINHSQVEDKVLCVVGRQIHLLTLQRSIELRGTLEFVNFHIQVGVIHLKKNMIGNSCFIVIHLKIFQMGKCFTHFKVWIMKYFVTIAVGSLYILRQQTTGFTSLQRMCVS